MNWGATIPRCLLVDNERTRPVGARPFNLTRPGHTLMVFVDSSHRTVDFRKYDSFAMWQASAAL